MHLLATDALMAAPANAGTFVPAQICSGLAGRLVSQLPKTFNHFISNSITLKEVTLKEVYLASV
jgi:hypothetical protein